MNTLSRTIEGEVYNANLSKKFNGWIVDRNGFDNVLVPYSRIFKINGIEYMVTGIDAALDLGLKLIAANDAAYVEFFAAK